MYAKVFLNAFSDSLNWFLSKKKLYVKSFLLSVMIIYDKQCLCYFFYLSSIENIFFCKDFFSCFLQILILTDKRTYDIVLLYVLGYIWGKWLMTDFLIIIIWVIIVFVLKKCKLIWDPFINLGTPAHKCLRSPFHRYVQKKNVIIIGF